MRFNKTLAVFIWFLVSLIMISCSDEKVDTSSIKEEMELRKFRKVDQGQLAGIALKEAQSIFDLADRLATDSSTNFDRIAEKKPLVKQLLELDAVFRLLRLKDTLQYPGIEKDLIIAYEFGGLEPEASNDNVQSLENGDTYLCTRAGRDSEKNLYVYAIYIPRRSLILQLGE